MDGNPGNPAPERLDRPFPLQTPSGGSPALTPYRSMTRHGLRRSAKKGLTSRGPLQKQTFLAWPTNSRGFCAASRQMRPVKGFGLGSQADLGSVSRHNRCSLSSGSSTSKLGDAREANRAALSIVYTDLDDAADYAFPC